MSIQQMLLGAGGAVATKTYVDDVFNTYLRVGTGANATVNNGIDLAGQGGLVWSKKRNNNGANALVDTVRGTTKWVQSNSSTVEGTLTSSSPATNSHIMQSFNSNGFTLGPDQWEGVTNGSSNEYSHWTFRKAPGFFDVVTWSGDGNSGRQISHSLGCVPGAIFTKRLNVSENWLCYHRDMGNEKYIHLNLTNTMGDATYFNDTDPTSTYFTVNDAQQINGAGYTYVAYVFAGGESTAATARGVECNGSSSLSIPDDDDWNLGQTFTIEAWVRPDNFDNNYNTIVAQYDTSNTWYFSLLSTGKCQFYDFSCSKQIDGDFALQTKVWTHIALVSNNGTGQWYVNGKKDGAAVTGINVAGNSSSLTIGKQGSLHPYDGKISNLRIVKGTAVYTSSFRPPTEPLTNITNTVLLCCNNSSVTGSTVTPGTITNSNVTAVNTSPFDDPAGFVFGESGSESVIKTGEYLGRGSALNPVVFLGFEPQFIMMKNISGSGPWLMYDSMRGLVTEGNDLYLQADEDDAEVTNADYLEITPTGFEINTSNSNINEEWSTYVFLAIRRPDGYVGKPPELGTDVFAMDTGNASSTIPAFDSNFPVDFIFQKEPASSSDNWYTGSRLTGSTNGSLNLGSAFGNWTDMVWDSNVGVTKNMTSSTQGWMFKRHAGFDVVTYVGDGVAGRHLPHSMNKAPEMVWIKLIDRDNHNWVVGHKGLDGGTNPWHKYLWLNTNDDEADGTWPWNDTAPTANHLVLGNGGTSNGDADPYIAMLFASVDGISKVGYYSGSNSSQTISTGFAPRFLIMKKVDTEQGWVVLDTVRGWGSGDDERLEFHNNSAQNDSIDFGAPTSSGFTLTGNVEKSNQSGGSYIYYAHA